MAYANGLLEQHVAALRGEASQVRLPQPKQGGRIVVPLTMREPRIDPVFGFSETHTAVLSCLFETLVASREEGRIVPALAERWEVAADGLHWTFRLRRGVTFHHGREVTADDVVFSFERLARLADEGAFVLASVRGVPEFRSGEAPSISGIRSPEPDVVTFELVEPVAFFLGLLALSFAGIVPRDVVDANPDGFGFAPVGTGPFKLRELTDERLALERYDGYRDREPPYLNEVEFDLKATPDGALEGVLAGHYAFTKYIPRARLPELLSNAEWRPRVLSITQPHCHYLLINSREGRVPDARARRAIAHAIDRESHVRHYSVAPIAEVAEGLVPPTCPGYDPSLRGPAYDPELARRLLDESGHDRSRPLELVLTTSPWTLGESAIERLVGYFDDVGLTVMVRAVDDLNETRRSGAFDLLESAWYGDYLDPDTFTFGAFHSRLGAFHGYCDHDDLDRLFERARATTDPVGRAELYREIHFAFQDFCPALVLLHRRDYIVHSPGVEGVHLYPLLPTVRPRDLWVHATDGK
jgi:peptide/nickel transport system substrate-binding protein/oligopeptide transport system substrate-binding protein